MVSHTSHHPLPEALIGRWRTFARVHPIRTLHNTREFAADGRFVTRSWIEDDDEDGRSHETFAHGFYEFVEGDVILLRADDAAVHQRLRLAIELDRYLMLTELDNGNVARVYERAL